MNTSNSSYGSRNSCFIVGQWVRETVSVSKATSEPRCSSSSLPALAMAAVLFPFAAHANTPVAPSSSEEVLAASEREAESSTSRSDRGYETRSNGASAGAPNDATEAAFDEYSKVSEKSLLLRHVDRTSLPPGVMRSLMGKFDLRRFDQSVQTTSADSPATLQWCRRAAEDTQRRRGEIDRNGDPLVTQEVLIERCSAVFSLQMKVSHRCGLETVEGRRYAKCTVEAIAELRKFRAVPRASGGVALEPDPTFGPDGYSRPEVEHTARSRVTGRVAAARKSALNSAANSTGTFLWLAIIRHEAFQLRAPVIANRGGYTRSCLGEDVVSLDQPFHVIEPGTDRRLGFVKARSIHDGCRRTKAHETKEANGEEVRLEPMRAKNILGGPRIVAGANLREMPSIGLAFGVHGGVAPLGGELVQPMAGLRVEQSLARLLGISELHASTAIRYAMVPADIQASRLQVDLGLVKRFYLMGPLFFGIGAYGTMTSQIGEDFVLEAVGGAGSGSLGLQVSPRWTARVTGGGRAAINLQAPGEEVGILGSLDVLYTF